MSKRIAQLYAEIGTDTTKLKSGLTGAKTEIRGFSSELKNALGISVPTSIAAGIVGIGVAAVKAANDFQKYAFEVEDFARTIGSTPEQASQFIQVADDVRISVEQLSTALKAAITRGYRPTIEGLGEMADAYNAIKDPIERSKFLVDTFGRSGLEMARIMELGSQKIKEMGDSIAGTGLEISQEDIASAEEYYKQLDQLGDAWQALKMSAGKIVLPVLIKIVGGFNEVQDGLDKTAKATDRWKEAVRQGIITQEEFTVKYTNTADSIDETAKSEEWLTKKTEDWKNKLRELGSVLPGTTGQMREGANAANDMADGLDAGADSTEKAKEEVSDFDDVLGALLARDVSKAGGIGAYLEEIGGAAAMAADEVEAMKDELSTQESIKLKFDFQIPNIADRMKNMFDQINWTDAGGAALQEFINGFIWPADEKLQEKLTGILAGLALAVQVEAGLVPKGDAITQLQNDFDMKYGEAKILIDAAIKEDPKTPADFLAFVQAEIDKEGFTAKLAIDESSKNDLLSTAKQYNDMIGAQVDKQVDVWIWMHMNGSTTYSRSGGRSGGGGGGNTNSTNEMRQHGGPVYNSEAYLVGELGPELFIPSTPGKIAPSGDMSAMSGGDTYNIYNYNEKTAALTGAVIAAKRRTRLNATMGV